MDSGLGKGKKATYVSMFNCESNSCVLYSLTSFLKQLHNIWQFVYDYNFSEDLSDKRMYYIFRCLEGMIDS